MGRYLVTGRLGRGGMGVVYQAEDTLLKRKVAIKLLPKEVSANPEALKRFLREAQSAAGLSHPNVVAVFDIGEAGGSHYIVMELITGGNAQEFIREHGAFHWTEATSILIDVCRGVAAAHQAGLIHRDIKPANILRSSEGVVKLADFGLVKPAGRKGTVVTALGGIVGTPHYMSPEQSQSATVDARSDVYSLGATYFALLTGRPPYIAADSLQVLFAHCSQPIPDPREINAGIPQQCADIIRKAMAKNRAQRYANTEALIADLEQALTHQPAATGATPSVGQAPTFVWSKNSSAELTSPFSLADVYPGEQTERVEQPTRRSRSTLALLAVGVLGVLLLGVIVGFLTLGRGVPSPTPPAAVVSVDDWPTLASVAEKAIRSRDARAMRQAIDRIQVMRNRKQDNQPAQQEAMRQILTDLDKARSFRESITEKGLVIGLDGIVTCVTFSSDDRLLGVGQGSGAAGAIVFDARTGEKRHTLWPNPDRTLMKVQDLDFTNDGSVLAAAFWDNRGVRLWHFAQGRETLLPLGPGVSRALSVAFAPHTKNLVAGLEPFVEGRGRPYLKIWDIETGREPFQFKAEHAARIPSVAFITGGQQVASGSQDKRVVLWNAETGRIWRELRTGLSVQAIACGPQGRTMAVAGVDQGDSVLQFWDYAGSQLLASKPSPHGACRCVAFSRDGTLLASGSGSRVLLWKVETQQLIAELPGHSQQVTSLAFSVDGGILATGSDDQTIRLWDVTRFLPPRTEP